MLRMNLLIFLLAFAGAAFGADQATAQSTALKDGGQLVIQKSGTMIHTDAAGNRVRMKDGNIMETKDGSTIIMKNNALWQTIAVKGTLHPNH